MDSDVQMNDETVAAQIKKQPPQPVGTPEDAENLKNQGNEEFKKGNYTAAIKHYSEALEIQKNEAILTNRAASYIQLKKYKEALFDCEQAIILNRSFLKSYQRAYKCYMSLGDLHKAKEVSLVSKDLGDAEAQKQIQLSNTLIDLEQKARQFIHDKQYQDATVYCTQLINYCPDCAKFVGLKIQAMIGNNKIQEAIEFSSKLQNQFIENPEYLFWRGKLLMYNGNLDMGKKYIREALNKDPDNVIAQIIILLDIQQTANEDEIKKAYRKAALRWHPDKHQNDDEDGKIHADKMFKDISEGYEILSDARKRNQYDQGADVDDINQGGGGGGGFHAHDPSEIFQMFFGGGGGGGFGGGGSQYTFRSGGGGHGHHHF